MEDLKISDELSKLIEERLKTNPDELIKVIINLDENVELEEAARSLTSGGVEVESTIPGPVPIVAGSVAANKIPELAKKSEIKLIEYDGKTYALG
jgi:hypothetical protein